jgi:hypothetical protein
MMTMMDERPSGGELGRRLARLLVPFQRCDDISASANGGLEQPDQGTKGTT